MIVAFLYSLSIVGIIPNNIEFGIVVQEEMQFKDISYLELRWPICSAEQHRFCSIYKGFVKNTSVKLF